MDELIELTKITELIETNESLHGPNGIFTQIVYSIFEDVNAQYPSFRHSYGADRSMASLYNQVGMSVISNVVKE